MNSNPTSQVMKRGMSGRGGQRGRMKQSTNSGSSANQALDGLYSGDRLVNVITSVVGCSARVVGKSGKQFEGIFKTISPEASLVLGKAAKVESPQQNGDVINSAEVFEQLVIHHKDWARVEFKDVNLEECYVKKDSFKTDSAITNNKLQVNSQVIKEKELERWNSGDSELALESMELPEYHMGNGWSAEKMFEKNEKMGVKSTYQEDMEEYTTKLEKEDTPEFRERERIAALKAEEIFKSSYEHTMSDTGRSEEQLYSAVVRNNKHVDKSSSNWRQPFNDRTLEPKISIENPGMLPVSNNQISVGTEETSLTQIFESEKPEKSVAGNIPQTGALQMPQELDDAMKSDNVKALDAHVEKVQHETLISKDPAKSLDIPKNPQKNPEIEGLKNFSRNFQLQDKKASHSSKLKKTQEENEEMCPSDEKEIEHALQEKEADFERKKKPGLNPHAQEFHPRSTYNAASPKSNNYTSSNGSAPPFSNHSSFTAHLYSPNNMYSRNGPRGRGMRQEYIDNGFVTATSATGQPFFAHHMPAQFMHPTHSMQYVPPAALRPPTGLQPPMVIQQHPHQGSMIVPVGQPAYDTPIYFGPAMPAMIHSPPHINSPSHQQSQFNFPPAALSQSVTPVRQVTPQPPSVISQQPHQPLFLMRNSNSDIQPTQLMNNRPQQTPNFPGN